MSAVSSRSSDGRKRRWEQHNSDRREAVLEAALTVLERDTEPGQEIKVQQIADEAAIHRTVVYRYFQDRSDLDLGIQREICRRLSRTMIASVVHEGSPRERIRRAVHAPARWVVDHPTWMRFAERDLGTSTTPLDDTIDELARQIETIMEQFIAVAGTRLEDSDAEKLTPWVVGVIVGSLGAVRSWMSRGGTADRLEEFTGFLADAIWLQVTGLASSLGMRVPDVAHLDATMDD